MSYKELKIVKPDFDSSLASAIFKLEKLKYKNPEGTVHPFIFIQLKEIFKILETLASARIEGNNTTLSEYVEKVIVSENKVKSSDEKLKEIENLSKAQEYINSNVVKGTKIGHKFIHELHILATKDLKKENEGSYSPGEYRKVNVSIKGSNHKVPDYTQVNEYMEELVRFIAKDYESKYKPLVAAIVHHRFVWIHPYDNGNGRVVRLLNYALLLSYGYGNGEYEIINPSAIFHNDREKYYRMLSIADNGDDQSILNWCDYVLESLVQELKKIDQLVDLKYTLNKILIPAISNSLEKKIITSEEYKILELSFKNGEIQNRDIQKIFPGKKNYTITRIINKLINKKMLIKKPESRKYCPYFINNYLLRDVIDLLHKEEFIQNQYENIR